MQRKELCWFPCSITYSTAEPQSYSIQFDVTTDTNSSCPVPGSF